MSEDATTTQTTEAPGTAPTPIQSLSPAAETTLLGGAVDPANPSTDSVAKPEGEAPAEGEAKPEADTEAAKPEGAPEAYDFKMPEGTSLDPVVVERFSEVAKELNLSQEAAQKFVDKLAPAMAERQVEAIKAVQTEWLNATKADKQFGGDKLTETVGIAQKALAAYGTPELKTLLDQSGLGNHPDVIRMLWKVGQTLTEDKVLTGGAGPQTHEKALSKLYPTMV